MLYKTITLELIQERPDLSEKLRSNKMLLTTVESYAIELKLFHEKWKEQLTQVNRGRDSRQIASEALELAVADLRNCLPSESPKDEAEPLSLDAAMNYIRRHSPPV